MNEVERVKQSHQLSGEEKLHDTKYLNELIESLAGDSDGSWWIEGQMHILIDEIRGKCGVCEDEE